MSGTRSPKSEASPGEHRLAPPLVCVVWVGQGGATAARYVRLRYRT